LTYLDLSEQVSYFSVVVVYNPTLLGFQEDEPPSTAVRVVGYVLESVSEQCQEVFCVAILVTLPCITGRRSAASAWWNDWWRRCGFVGATHADWLDELNTLLTPIIYLTFDLTQSSLAGTHKLFTSFVKTTGIVTRNLSHPSVFDGFERVLPVAVAFSTKVKDLPVRTHKRVMVVCAVVN
jgi:hypothetical protein